MTGTAFAQLPDSSESTLFAEDFDGPAPTVRTSGGKYFEINPGSSKNFAVSHGTGLNGSNSMRAHWDAGQNDAGSLHVLFGRTPNDGYRLSDIRRTENFREIFWRMYLKMDAGWEGDDPGKLTRAFIFAEPSNWGQAMIAHLWGGPVLKLDPVSGVKESAETSRYELQAKQYNDFSNLRWLGAVSGKSNVYSRANVNRWLCIEAHVKLNEPGESDGVFEYWIDGGLEARKEDIDWVGDWQEFGINAIYFENYSNIASPVSRTRDWDNLAVATKRIGCL